MALMHLNFNSRCLSGSTDVNIILPDLTQDTAPKEFYVRGKKYPVLWLLHGSFGDYTDWVRKTNIEVYAAEKELIVVMPSAHNTDYANWAGFGTGYLMYDYLTEELMPLVYAWFPASDKREDNFIAGLSMGGRGAIMYAYAHPEKFAAMYSMSCVPQDMRLAAAKANDAEGLVAERTRNRLENAGGLAAYLVSPQNTWDRTAEIAGRTDMPKLYFACGTADFMYQDFLKFRAYAQKLGLNAQFTEAEGYAHEWRVWEKCIQDALGEFLPDQKQV